MVSIDDMMVFCQVAEKGSFTKAAKELSLGKARVSQIVSALEDKIGNRLLERTTRSLSLTEVGRDYFDQCLKIREIALNANTAAQSIQIEPTGMIRISAPLGTSLLTEILSSFLRKYPKISLDIFESDRYESLFESHCDIAIRSSLELEDSSLYAFKMGELEEIICASSDTLARIGQIENPHDLTKLEWISHDIVHGSNHLVLRPPESDPIKLRVSPKVLVRSTASLRYFILNHIGFGVLPRFVVNEDIQAGKVVQILPDFHDVKIPLYAIYKEKSYMPLKVRVLLDHLKEHHLAI